MSTDLASEDSANEAFWEQKVTEAREAGGSVEFDIADIPPVGNAAITISGCADVPFGLEMVGPVGPVARIAGDAHTRLRLTLK